MRYWLGLGSNLGDRARNLQAALDLLAKGGADIEAVSPVYSTAPRDVPDQPDFLNAAARVATPLDPPALLDLAKSVERRVGRRPGARFGPRTIDCDLLLWEGGAFGDVSLSVPHPRLRERRFALLPLLDLDPGLAMPDGTPLRDLADALDPREQPVLGSAATLRVPRAGALD